MKGGFQKLEEQAIQVGQKAKAKAQEVSAGIQQHRHKKHNQNQGKQGPGQQDKGVEDFDGDVIPPDWQIADDHRSAWQVGHSNKENPKVCPCCARHIERIPLPLNFHERDLAFLGSGLPLYFDFIKGCISILLIFFVTSGDYNILTNYQYGGDCTPESNCPDVLSNRLSLANKRSDPSLNDIQEVMNFVSIIVLVVALQFFRRSQREIAEDCDNAQTFASDFSILVVGIPTNPDGLHNNDFDDDLLNFWLEEVSKIPQDATIINAEKIRQRDLGQQYKPLRRVATVNLCYRLDEQTDKSNQKAALLVQKQKLLSTLYGQGYEPGNEDIKQLPEYIDIQNQIDIMEKELEAMEEKFYNGQGVSDYFLGSAVVTFQWEADRNAILDIYMKKQTLFAKKPQQCLYRDTVVQISEPAEPTDVYWENLHLSAGEKRKRRIIGDGLTFIVLLACSAAIYFLSMLQQHETLEQDGDKWAASVDTVTTGVKTPVPPSLVSKGLAILASILIVVINTVLGILIGKLSNYMGFATQTDFNISVAFKSSVAQTCNTALITFLISIYITENIYGTGGLVMTQTTVFFMNVFIPIIIDLLDGAGLFVTIMQWWERRKGNKSVKTQQQLNTFMERPPFAISARYAVLLKSMYVTAFYATIIPVSLIITCFYLYFFSWMERVNIIIFNFSKLNISKRRSIKFNYGSDLSYEMIDSLEYVLPIYCAMNFYWEYSFSGGNQVSIWAIIGIVIGVVNALLPMQQLNEMLFPSPAQIPNPVPYQEAEVSFLTDYARENPATSERARELFFERVAKHKQEKLYALQMAQNQIQGMFSR